MPRSPTVEEHQHWRQAAEAFFQILRRTEEREAEGLGRAEHESRLAALEAAITEAREWMDAGYPAHPVLGIEDLPDGLGGAVRYLDWQTESRGWTGHD